MLGISSLKSRREQQEQLENQVMGKEGKTDQTSKAQPWENKKWQYACRLFRTNSLKELAI
jgi:hypothetical protein